MEFDEKAIICRVCLHKIAPTVKCFYIFQQHEGILTGGTNDVIIADKITSISKVEINKDDGLPNKICTMCLLELNAAYEFKLKCEKSDGILRLKTRFDHSITYPEVPVEETSEIHKDDFNNKTLSSSDHQDNNVNHQQQSDSDKVIKKSKAIDLKLVCDRCNKMFKSKCKMQVHWKREHSKYTCLSCKYVFKSLKAYQNHQQNRTKFCLNAHKIRIEGSDKTLMTFCNDCNYKTKSKLMMLNHLTVHSKEKAYTCDICLKKYTQQASLERHKELVHKLISAITKTCHVCGEVIAGQYKFFDHMSKKHGEKKRCPTCNKEFSARHLRIHMRIHSKIRSYICDICSRAFVTPAQLSNHISKQHKQKEVHTCKICGYETKDPYRIRKHENTHNAGNVACRICGYFVVNDAVLEMHMKQHLVKPHKCDYCDKKFCYRKSLTHHYRAAHKIFVSKERKSKLCVKRELMSKQKIPKPKFNIKYRTNLYDAGRSK